MLKFSSVMGDNDTNLWAVKRRLRDYAYAGRQLLVQRLAIYLCAIFLSGAYYNPYIAAIFLVAVGMFESFDSYVFHRILKQKTWRPENIKNAMIAIHIGALLSTVTISSFCISVARQQSMGDGHFFPQFMLVSAAIFGAMNSHQFLSVLAIRLSIFVLAILYTPIHDLWIVRPPLSSEMWLNLFTMVFVLGFIMELGRNFLAGYSRDLRSREKLEQEHRLTKAALEAKTRFLATMNHELRTPLTSIKGSFDLLNSGGFGSPPQKMERLLEVASRNTNKLKELVDDLLFLQTSDIGKVKFQFKDVDLKEIVEEATERFRPQAVKSGITLQVAYKPGEYRVCADQKRIDQVLMNLLSNAAKFSKKNGTITVALETDEDRVRLLVRDDGIGIQEDSEELVFAEFTQLDSSDGREYDGTGLGLSISKKIVEAHHGEIGYTSELGVGTEFYVELQKVSERPLAS
ncbi:Two-component sensor [Sulfitobacter noctilucicola]|uniref:histidine kinase n=1 Tax=Sulfitobacter noctilucicola TaxID=1342301 RepID=A0A7W6M9H7_9RHOB|nr:HAMP domain-containing sensor histidine kinase [Sulfitobacter noctilucicola]KIN63571.1 Two-component sensor [Sulfitobacter noctilucicola]MBB4174919.1 signal transduction histidine kinase [Sulfitobacter noctilucicola]